MGRRGHKGPPQITLLAGEALLQGDQFLCSVSLRSGYAFYNLSNTANPMT